MCLFLPAHHYLYHCEHHCALKLQERAQKPIAARMADNLEPFYPTNPAGGCPVPLVRWIVALRDEMLHICIKQIVPEGKHGAS